jgi:regulator of nonsense transcripts 1
LGFVPASTSSVVVLLCRVCVETVPALKDMDWDLAGWHPLIQDRRFVPWLLAEPSDRLQLRAREITVRQMTALEDLWKGGRPDARYRDLASASSSPLEDGEGGAPDVQPVLRSYEDGYHYQNVLAPLVKIEADYDRQLKETLSEESVSVRWETSLSNRPVAVFSFRSSSHNIMEQSRIVVGDELRLRLGIGKAFVHSDWQAVGYVKSIVDGEVQLELSSSGRVPDTSDDYVVEYLWKSTSYDRMQHALKTFAVDDASVTGYLYHKLLGHDVADQLIALPANGAAGSGGDEPLPPPPGLPPLNPSQAAAVRAVLERPLSLIQVSGRATSGREEAAFCAVATASLFYRRLFLIRDSFSRPSRFSLPMEIQPKTTVPRRARPGPGRPSRPPRSCTTSPGRTWARSW